MSLNRVLVNGCQTGDVDYSDRGFQYGDGVFETIAVVNHIPLFLSQHLHRLYLGCSTLSIPFSDQSALQQDISILLSLQATAVLKIQITRGVGGRGYRSSGQSLPTRVVSLHPMPNYSEAWVKTGIQVCYCKTQLSINPRLAMIKHMNRLEQILARQEWTSADIHEGLMLDSEGFVVEGTMSNLFWVKRGQLYTPEIDRCGVAGVMRSVILKLAGEQGEAVNIKRCTMDDLEAADELFVTNSIIGLWPVRALGDVHYSQGSVTAKVRQWLDSHVKQVLTQT